MGCKSFTSQGDTINGTFKHKVRYPASDKTAVPTTLFSTQVPTFWNTAQLSTLLRSEGVTVNAEVHSQSTSLLAEILLGFGPTLLLVGLFVLLDAARPRVAAGLGGIGPSAARRPGGSIRPDPGDVR